MESRRSYQSLSPVEVEEKKPCCHSFWTDSALINRINIWGSLSVVFDGAMSMARSMAGYNDDFEGWVGMAVYSLPSCIPFIPTMINRCRKNKHEEPLSDEEKYADQIDFCARQFKDIENAFERDHDSEEQLIINTIIATNNYHRTANLEKIGILINTSYLAFRAIRGALMLMELYDLADQGTNDGITTVTDYAHNIISYFYLVALLIRQYLMTRNSLKKKAKPITDEEDEIFKKHARAAISRSVSIPAHRMNGHGRLFKQPVINMESRTRSAPQKRDNTPLLAIRSLVQ